MIIPNKTSMAYDLARFDVEERPVRQIRETKVHHNKSDITPIKVIMLTLVFAAVCGVILYCKAREDELSKMIYREQQALNVSMSENTRLNSEMTANYNLKAVEQTAQLLGMSKVSKSQVEYVDIDTNSLIQINRDNTSENVFIKIKHGFSDLMEYLGF